MSSQDMTDEQQEAREENAAINEGYQKMARQIPINDYDAVFRTVDPDYAEITNNFQHVPFARVLHFFKSGFRLGNIQANQAKVCESEFALSAEAYDLKLESVAFSFLTDTVARLEFSNSIKGFRSKMMNTLKQILSKETTKKRVAGNKEED